jgi:hypothetical protein
LLTYEVDDVLDDIKSVADLWGGNSIFYYDPKKAIEMVMKEEEETTADRPPDFLK